ncbi:MAG: low molecular weight phosphotyrosine protein phosphatase, partial [Rhodocyclaceae bacterium]|nr:low molecular weight phosphotyrosine protein phosphatase [Rhodocyclaceae bacterium]
MKALAKHKVLFVCMGNICRSPTAEGVTRALAERMGLAEGFEFDSAGTHGYHIGHPPDARAQAAAARRGYDLSALRARQVNAADFVRFDHILAMDRDNLRLLRQACQQAARQRWKQVSRLLVEAARTDRQAMVWTAFWLEEVYGRR